MWCVEYREGMVPDTITYFAETDARGRHVRFGIKQADRQYHMAIIGRTGMGKSTLLKTLMLSDMRDFGFALLDPHGDLAESIVNLIPENRRKDMVYFNPGDPGNNLGFNILEAAGTKKSLVVSGVISLFKKIWSDSWGPRMEHLFRYALTTLVEVKDTTLADVSRILIDSEYRASILEHIADETVLDFWRTEYARYGGAFKTEAISPLQNKLGAFLVNSDIRKVVTKTNSDFSVDDIMQSGGILIANLSKGKLGEDGSALLGALLSTKFELAALNRVRLPEENRQPFYLYVDEFPTLANESFSGMLNESRKYGLSLILAMQFVEQLDDTVRNALFENVGTLTTFRAGPGTARYLAPQFEPWLSKEDLMNIGRYRIYIKLMIDGVPSKPFSARTIKPGSQPA